MKNWVATIGLLSVVLSSAGQVQYVLPLSDAKSGALTAVAQDWEAIGVNPANLGWNTNHSFSFTILNAGISGQSEGMRFSGLMDAFYGTSLLTRANAWQGILGSRDGMNTNADVNWFAISFKVHEVPGTFAVNMTDKIASNAFLGLNASQAINPSGDRVYSDATTLALLNGTNLTYTHYREINLDYGVRLFNLGGTQSDTYTPATSCFSFSNSGEATGIYAGIGVKYIMGIANVNGSVSNGALAAQYDINEYYPNIPSGFFNTPGQGEAIDLGIGIIHGRWKAGVSLIDIGSIRWHHGYKTTTDTGIASIIHGSDFINELKNGTLPGSSQQSDYTTSLPSEMKGGVSYYVNKRVSLSSDIILPINNVPGGLAGPYFALGSQLKVSKHITLSPGLAVSVNDEWAIPVGVTINATSNLEFYMGTGDITSYIGKSNADVSLAVGFLRLYF